MRWTWALVLVLALAWPCASGATAGGGGAPGEAGVATPAQPGQEEFLKRMHAQQEEEWRVMQEVQESMKRGLAPVDQETARLLIEMEDMARPQPPRVILVPTGEMDPEQVKMLTEDLAIMSRVIDKALVQALGEEQVPQMPTPLGFQPAFARQEDQPKQALYLEGYGAVFMLSVRFPLVADAAVDVQLEQAKREPESLWEQTQREMQAAPGVPAGGETGALRIRTRVASGQTRGMPAFRPDQVEKLRNALLDALREAGHIRGLGPDEAISIVVAGSGTGAEVAGFGVVSFTADAAPPIGETGPPPSVQTTFEIPPLQSAVLTLHVRKADVDALAAGKMQIEEFGKRATIVIR